MRPMKQAIIECPMKDREPHTRRKPERLDETAVKHIEHQIARNNYPPLPRTLDDSIDAWIAAQLG